MTEVESTLPFNVYLVGPMGVGKTTLGRLLSRALNAPFVDVDKEIEERAGADIPWIFDVEGEEGFREREHLVLQELASMNGQIIATGGGIIKRADNREILRRGEGVVIYLQASAEELIQRLKGDKTRPLLRADNPEKVIKQLIGERSPLYEQVSDIVHKTARKGPASSLKQLVQKLKKLKGVAFEVVEGESEKKADYE